MNPADDNDRQARGDFAAARAGWADADSPTARPLDEILELARWTPSPHNTQPWLVRLRPPARLDLLLDPRRALPDEDVTGCFVTAALGMFIESLACAAANRGHRVDVEIPDIEAARRAAAGPEAQDAASPPGATGTAPAAGGTGRPDPGGGPPAATTSRAPALVARLALSADADRRGAFEDRLLLERRTSRLPPDATPLPAAVLEAVEREAAAAGQHLHVIEDAERVRAIMRLNLRAVVEDLNTPRYRDEVVSWFRYSRSQERDTRDGLSARCMAIPPWEMATLARWPGAARWPLLGVLVRALYRHRLGPVPRLMALAGPFWGGAEALNAGRCLMRAWLLLERHGLRIHPFGNLITNGTAREDFCDITGIEDPWIVFRVGYTRTPPRSERLRLEEIIVD